ncbi:hypothetical protein JG688_00014979 [Phytophthora aleatoria]|uniref:Uncharacterized protein n=1 Tax=Phytophthora aleatoria TaxID=2496075 RepID=A0A8J5LX67_9STRA|nr:hypothetical protein JG688_00014979 [Phytophthora aleatoria]
MKDKQPTLIELSSFLTSFEVRYGNYRRSKITVEKRVPNVEFAAYRLPEQGTLPNGVVVDLTISVNKSAECWVVTIDKVVDFTRWQYSMFGI